MSTRDSHFSFIHLEDPNHVLYMEKWNEEPIPFDDIDTHALFEATANLFPQYLLEEEEDGGIPISSSTIGAKIFKDRKLLKERTWTDIGIYERFSKTTGSSQRDETILKHIYTNSDSVDEFTIADFLSNGYEADEDRDQDPGSPDMVNDSIMGGTGDLSLNSTSDFIGPSSNTFTMNPTRSVSNSSTNQIQTPRPPRTRQPSSDRNFQTPITRIIR
ncbi:hypothetical protein CLIB1423_03S05974 [[Candida] railenensis]|uniref:Uncharacterized protein n=1 Tax=[Candida] railenensis TaxID=45579 RepID=A0A9P0VX09_9ASCO|nr:hypothetical protein CLIB1423_03S05974 [[Candida] railenensis]